MAKPYFSTGHAYGDFPLLTKYCGFEKPPTRPVPYEWQHGWMPSFLSWPTEALIGTDGLSRFRKESHLQLVASDKQALQIEQDGYKSVAAIGLPFTYVVAQGYSRINNSRLYVLEHGTFQDKDRFQTTLNKIYRVLEISKEKSPYMLIHGADLNEEVISFAREKKVRLVLGAHNNDETSLKRVRQIFETFETIATDYIGSHVLYSTLSGAVVEFVKTDLPPIQEMDLPERKFYRNSPEAKVQHGISRALYQEAPKLAELIVNNGLDALTGAQREAGFFNQPSPSTLRKLLGFHIEGPKVMVNFHRTWQANEWIFRYKLGQYTDRFFQKKGP
jgi:hypothetical protein